MCTKKKEKPVHVLWEKPIQLYLIDSFTCIRIFYAREKITMTSLRQECKQLLFEHPRVDKNKFELPFKKSFASWNGGILFYSVGRI